MDNINKAAIKCFKIVSIFEHEKYFITLFLADMCRYNYQIGLGTLVVYTVKFGCKIMKVLALCLESTFARLKLKETGGNLHKRWNMWFNTIIHVKSY